MTVRFTVSGDGRFPFDMLRHDACFPASGTDAANLPEPNAALLQSEGRDVELISHTRFRPTSARWESFGWVVTDVEPQQVEEG